MRLKGNRRGRGILLFSKKVIKKLLGGCGWMGLCAGVAGVVC